VISDGSNDKTNEIVDRFKNSGVLLRNYEGRSGKTACLNKAVPLANGNIIVFSDANSLYDQNSIKNLVKHFSDDGIGFVTGYTKYSKAAGSDVVKSIGIYSTIEKITKRLESRIGSCVGADGAIFAIRKKLYQPLKDCDINDFVIPLNIVNRGYRGIIEENAFCVEGTAEDSSGEFNRQARITNRTIRALFNNLTMLNPLKFGIFSLKLIFHKLFKYLVPLFLMLLLITNLFLINEGTFYAVFFVVQVALYLFSFVEYKGNYFKLLSKLTAFARTFLTVNAAILLGWIQYFKGETYTTWNTIR
jgi:cellulose synthase/poly-beta-1,6-N-acetylglucosamine synthase-like glycosyltransferase